MPLKKRQPKARIPGLSETARAHLLGLEPPEDADTAEGLWLATGHDAELWRRHGAELTAAWIAEHPGTRPWAWWEWSAPRQPRGRYPAWYDGRLPEPRRHVGGSGRPAWEAYPAMVPIYDYGVPRHLHGVDPDDPPRYESEAAYLERHGLLLPGEERRSTAEDFEPEPLTV